MDNCFRPFSREDGPAVAQLIHQLYVEDPGGRIPSGLQIQRTFEELTQHPEKGMILVFEHENDVIGYTILINYWSNEYGGNILHVDELFILPEFRGKGIASDFIKYLYFASPSFGHDQGSDAKDNTAKPEKL
ncbi:MAG: GNAT family N-acetyltransferase [Saprospiraceae bacterium]|nr:GNAT family N-acetyltransferase [Saprospiraceae bacterium]